MRNIDIKNMLLYMTNDTNNNLRNIKNVFGMIDYKDEEGQSILHILVDNKYDEDKCFLAIKTLLQAGLSPNINAYYNYNFIQTALYTGYSEKFIINIIKEALKYNLDINHVDNDKDTIMHTVIYSDDYLDGLENIYELLCDNGFDSSLKDSDDRNLVEAMIFQQQYSEEQIQSFDNKFRKRYKIVYKDSNFKEVKTTFNSITPVALSGKDVLSLEKYGKILNLKDYNSSPAVGRESELKNLMVTLAQDKKNPLIVGESGVGKTTIVDELAYRIKEGQVPKFLQDKVILEINSSDVVAGCEYVGMFEDNMSKLMKLCEKLDVIVFIDEIHTIYGVGATKDKNNDMSSILKYYIDRANLKVIGTTTEKEYNEFFSNDALKRRFEKITIKEPTKDILYEIIDKVIENYCLKNGMSFKNENTKKQVVDIILDATEKSHRVYNDIVNNPDLAISIIDKAFAFAKFDDSGFICAEHFAKGFEYCDRIYESAREDAQARLRNLDISEVKPSNRVLKINFNRFRK